MPVPEGIFNLFMQDVACIDAGGYVRAPAKPSLGYDIDWGAIEENIVA